MAFMSGPVSFRRFLVVGQRAPELAPADIDRLKEHALRPAELGVPEEIEYGWCAGRHILDRDFGFDANVFAEALHCAIAINTNRVPASLKAAWLQEEQKTLAAANPSGFISKAQKHQARDTLRLQIEQELRSGKHIRSKMLPVLWHPGQRILYTPATGGALDMLTELFERTFNLELQPLTAGDLAARYLINKGRQRDYEDFRPTPFAPGPGLEGENQEALYPWIAHGPQPKDYLGNEFLVWLWHQADASAGTLTTARGFPVSFAIDRSLEMECAFGQTGKDTFKGDGPARLPEARDALRCGKVPRRLGLLLVGLGHGFELSFNSETFACLSTRLPDVQDADTPRVIFEERIGLLADLCTALDALYETFLDLRASSDWEAHTAEIRRWIAKR